MESLTSALETVSKFTYKLGGQAGTSQADMVATVVNSLTELGTEWIHSQAGKEYEEDEEEASREKQAEKRDKVHAKQRIVDRRVLTYIIENAPDFTFQIGHGLSETRGYTSYAAIDYE